MNQNAQQHFHFARWVRAGSSVMEFEVPIDRNSMNAFMEIWFLGAYDSLKPSRGSVVIDAGANVGLFTLRASEWVGESGRVIAVEPVPHNCEILSRNLARNNIQNVTVVPKAVSDASGRIELYGKCVDTVALDELLEDLGADFPEAIKIDIEGFEVKALRGAKRTLAHARRLAFETHSESLEREVRSLLVGAGFQVHNASFNEMVAKLAGSIVMNPVAFTLSELDRTLSWRRSRGPFLFEPLRWLAQFRRPDWMSPESGLKLITAERS